MIVIPVKTVSGMNAREHHMARSRRVKGDRTATSWALCQTAPPVPPCTVKLTRLAPSNGLDSDNLQSSMKGVRDQIAEWIGIDDKSPLVTWQYEQLRARDYGVIVEVSP